MKHELDYFGFVPKPPRRPWRRRWILTALLLTPLHAVATFILTCVVAWGSDVLPREPDVPKPIIALQMAISFPASLITAQEYLEPLALLLNSAFQAGLITAAYLFLQRGNDASQRGTRT